MLGKFSVNLLVGLTRLCDANDIAVLKSNRNCLSLDGGRFLVAYSFNAFKE